MGEKPSARKQQSEQQFVKSRAQTLMVILKMGIDTGHSNDSESRRQKQRSMIDDLIDIERERASDIATTIPIPIPITDPDSIPPLSIYLFLPIL